MFSEDGGIDSERTYIKQVLQKHVTDETTSEEEDLFGADDIEK